MGILDVRCKESICLTEDCYYINNQKENLFLGDYCNHSYVIYLYFDLQVYECLNKINSAKIILFKIPLNGINIKEKKKPQKDMKYDLYPLIDCFSMYSYMYSSPKVMELFKVTFDDDEVSSYTEVDITEIVTGWRKNTIENRGVILIGGKKSMLLKYASYRNRIVGMRPILRINYEGTRICKPLSVSPCVVKIGD